MWGDLEGDSVDVGEAGEEEVPGDAVEDQTEEQERVPVSPPGPAGLDVLGIGGGGGGGGKIPGEDIVYEGVVVVFILHLPQCQQPRTDSHQEDRQPNTLLLLRI